MSFLSDIWKGHLLQFEKPLARLPAGTSFRYAVAFLICGVALLWLGRRVTSGADFADPLVARFIFVVLLTALSLAAARICLGDGWAALGLRWPTQWSRREILYVIQVAPAASIAFFLIFQELINRLIADNGFPGFLIYNLGFGLAWGFYQEFAYRGLLQNPLSSWFGPVAGVLLANLVFTFGPLHASIYADAASDPSRALAFIPVFAIGLVFGVIYQRSGNLWLPAIFHGLWPLNMTG